MTSLDEYRLQVLARLRACEGPDEALRVLAEAECVLDTSGLRDRAVRTFWQDLSDGLEVIAQESTHLLDKQAFVRLSVVISASLAAITEYRAVVGDGSR